MNVGELKKLLSDLDDRTEIVMNVAIESGRDCFSGGVSNTPSFNYESPGEFIRAVNGDTNPDGELWIVSDEGAIVNSRPLLVIDGSVDEEWYE